MNEKQKQEEMKTGKRIITKELMMDILMVALLAAAIFLLALVL